MPLQHAAPAQSVLLLTGATGQIGRPVLRTWLRQGNRVVVTLRAPHRQMPELMRWLTEQSTPTDGLTSVRTDFSVAGFGWGEQEKAQLRQVTCVAHLAAMWGWQLNWAEADQVNVQATMALHRWAAAAELPGPFLAVCGFMSQVPGHLERMGLLNPHVDWAAAAQRHGAYEVSKLKAYVALRQPHARSGGLPITWIHPATVIGDTTVPDVPLQSAVSGILLAIHRGLLRLAPGRRTDVVPWVTGNHVSEYVAALLAHPDPSAQEHVLLDPASPCLRDAIDIMATAMGARRAIGNIPMPAMRKILSVPGVSRLLDTPPESLNFIVPAAPDAAASVAWGAQRGIVHPDVRQALALTAAEWKRRHLG